MKILRRIRAAIRNVGRFLGWLLWDREFTLLVLFGIAGFVAGIFDRLFKRKGEKW